MKIFFNLVMAFTATMILASSCDKEPTQAPEQDNTVNFTADTFIGAHMSLGESGMYMVLLSDEDNIYNYLFTLYNNLGEIDDNGYVTIPSGTYTQSEVSEDYTISSYAIYTDKSGGVENAKTTALTNSTAVVTENQIVLTTVIDSVTHVVTYNGPLSMSADLPDPNVDFVADHAYAYYSESTSEDNVAKFKLFLSDIGHDEDGNALPNGTYYRFTLCVDKLDSNAEIAIPAGRYKIGDTDSATVYIAEDVVYYKFGETTSERAESDMIESGYLTVNEDGSIEASLDMYFSGATHIVSFYGDVEILENTIPSEAPYSTLTSDKVCDLSDHSLSGYARGDIYGVGYQSLMISISPDDSVGDNLVFEILRGTDTNVDISGKYTIGNSMDEFTALPGYVDGFTLMSSWYYYQDNSMNISEYAPLVDGWVEIQVNDEDTYIITLSAYDDLNNNITGTFTYAPSDYVQASVQTNVQANVSGVSHQLKSIVPNLNCRML